jgi:hypothetical protein
MSNGWIGVDLDGTLAEYSGWKGAEHIGAPIPLMVQRITKWLAQGIEVRIFTARVFAGGRVNHEELQTVVTAIEKWCSEHIGIVLPITCTKDYGMVELWDDRAVQVIPNTGVRADGKEING